MNINGCKIEVNFHVLLVFVVLGRKAYGHLNPGLCFKEVVILVILTLNMQ